MKQNENIQNYKKPVHTGRGHEAKREIPTNILTGAGGSMAHDATINGHCFELVSCFLC
jgi:hypothetical protein